MKSSQSNKFLIFIGLSISILFATDIMRGLTSGGFEFHWRKFGITFYGVEAIAIEACFLLLGLLLTYLGIRGYAK